MMMGMMGMMKGKGKDKGSDGWGEDAWSGKRALEGADWWEAGQDWKGGGKGKGKGWVGEQAWQPPVKPPSNVPMGIRKMIKRE